MIRKASTEKKRGSNKKPKGLLNTPELKRNTEKVKPISEDYYKVYTIVIIKGETHSKLTVFKFEDCEREIFTRIYPNRKYEEVLEKEKKDIGKKFLKSVIEKEGVVELPKVKSAKVEAKKNDTDEDILTKAELRKNKKKYLLKDASTKIDKVFDSINTTITIKDGFIEIYLKNAILKGKPLATGSHKISIDIDNEEYYYFFNGKLIETASTILKILR
jgi:hypothetical protein